MNKSFKPTELASDSPWLDVRLPEEVMNHLWKCIGDSEYARTDNIYAQGTLAGNISKSAYFEDKGNFFYDNYVKELVEHLYYKSWINYHDVVLAKTKPPPEFTMKRLWVNYQKQHEFNPPHNHDGWFSFVIFMKIPTHWKEQHTLPIAANSNSPMASDFQFIRGVPGNPDIIQATNIPLCPDDEGRMLFFPAWLTHQVFPFYGTEEERITISGNIIENRDAWSSTQEEEEDKLRVMEEQLRLHNLKVNEQRKHVKRFYNK